MTDYKRWKITPLFDIDKEVEENIKIKIFRCMEEQITVYFIHNTASMFKVIRISCFQMTLLHRIPMSNKDI